MARVGPNLQHRCPRCGEVGDPRMCNCMARLRRYTSEARRLLRLGETMHAGGQLHEAERLLEQLALDAQKQGWEQRARRGRGRR